jgi:copper chaperone CopZ
VRAAVERLEGVQAVDVSYERGQADITLRARNALSLQTLRDALARAGFRARNAEVTLIGDVILRDRGAMIVRASGLETEFSVAPGGASEVSRTLRRAAIARQALEISGVVTGETPAVLAVQRARAAPKEKR